MSSSKSLPSWLLILCAGLTLQDTSALEVRVRDHNGVPQIHIDGQPVRGRMFFGAARVYW